MLPHHNPPMQEQQLLTYTPFLNLVSHFVQNSVKFELYSVNFYLAFPKMPLYNEIRGYFTVTNMQLVSAA